MNRQSRKRLLMHIIVWVVLFVTPLMFLNMDRSFSWSRYLSGLVMPIMLCIVFYVNYLWLAPRYYIHGNKNIFWICNIVIVLGIGLLSHMLFELTTTLDPSPHPMASTPQTANMHIMHIIKDVFNLSISAALATGIAVSLRWSFMQERIREAEAARHDAELRNLRDQVNPHFLLNTLNNIYALTSMDTQRAQSAILQLSDLMRHILYNTNQPMVSLQDEISFLRNYINLMKLRLSYDVELIEDIHEQDVGTRQIAPMLLISLVENAFKHGISPLSRSFIHIHLHTTPERIEFEVINSNHQGKANGLSGHGIGLKQVQQRLDLSYPNHYEWDKGISSDQKNYHSKIIIYDH